MPPLKFSPLLLLLFFAAACSAIPLFEDRPQTPQLFTDLPMPPELETDEGDTKIYEGPGGRVGRLVASTRVGRVALINYYREGMRRHGWAAEGEFDEKDAYTMVFSKKPRSAAIKLREGWVYTDVEINVGSKRQ